MQCLGFLSCAFEEFRDMVEGLGLLGFRFGGVLLKLAGSLNPRKSLTLTATHGC